MIGILLAVDQITHSVQSALKGINCSAPPFSVTR